MPLRCLIVDDNASFREEMRGLLAEQGLDVVGGAGVRRPRRFGRSPSCDQTSR